MAKKSFAVKHNLDQLSKEELVQYLREVSEFIGLDPDLNGLDTIWMNNETGPGRSLVVYARRGTAEILRNIYGVEVETLTYAIVNGSMVFTATGRAKARDNRQEIAIGSKFLGNVTGKELDDSIMTASTRALRRLTMQFTTLGILDESEVVALIGHAPNPAGSAQLVENSLPPVFAAPSVPANNAPGKPVESTPAATPAVEPPTALGEPFLGQQDQIDAAWKQVADKQAATKVAEQLVTPTESTTSTDKQPDIEAATEAPKPKRKSRKSVSLEVEPEVVSSKKPVSANVETAPKSETKTETKTETKLPAATSAALATAPQKIELPAPPPQNPAPEPAVTQAPPSPAPVSTGSAPVAGLPTPEQMNEYRAKIGVFTKELPASEGLDSTRKMRAFITHLSGTIPQNMTAKQWDDVVAFFDGFMANNTIKNLVKYINDSLGVK